MVALLTLKAYCEDGDALAKASEEAKNLAEYLSFEKIAETLTFNISSCLKSLASSFGVCVAVILISAVFSAFKESFASYEGVFDIISCSILTASSFAVILSCFETTQKAIVSICSYMMAFVPVSAALLASSGNSVTAGAGSVVNSFFISTAELLSVSLVLPLVKAIVTLHAVNSLSKKSNLNGIATFLKSCCLWIIGLSFTLFTGILSLQTVLSSGADNLALKGIRFSAARLIPIAGGMISESMKTVIASMNYIKSVTGTGAIVFVVYSVAIPLCAVMCTKLFFLALSALAKAANQNAASGLFDGLNGSINILLALLLGCTVSFVVMLAMFIKVTVSL